MANGSRLHQLFSNIIINAETEVKLTLGNHAQITGDVYANGNSTIRLDQAQARITGNVWANGDLIIEIPINARIAGNIYLGNLSSYVMGDGIYATGHIYSEENKGTFDYDTVEEAYVGEPPFPQPECPGMPLNPVEIFTWTID